ncbi:MAG: VOC family protein [Actinomycetota bacterium]
MDDIIRPSKLAHIVLRSSHFDEVIAWWSTVLGAEPRHESPFLTFLSYDDEHHRLAVINNPNLRDNDRQTNGVEHIAFTYDSLDDLLATYQRLKGHGIVPVWPVHHGMTMSLYYADPDGNQVELQVDVMDEPTAAAFMASDVFAANPIGVPLDPEDLIVRRDAGESLESLTEYVPA